MSGNNDTTDSDNGNKGEIVPAEKARKKYMAEQELAQFAKLYFARASEEMICRELKIHRSTYYRYLERLGEQQHELLTEHLDASTYAEIASFRNTLRFVEIHLKTILLAKESLDENKIEAAQLLCDVAHAQVKLHTQGPIRTLKEIPMSLKKKMKEVEEQEEQKSLPEVIEIKTEEIVEGDKDKQDAAKDGSET